MLYLNLNSYLQAMPSLQISAKNHVQIKVGCGPGMQGIWGAGATPWKFESSPRHPF